MTAYARAIERLLTERLDRAPVLSPRDWATLTEWHARGIPLELVADALDAALERRPRGKHSRSPAWHGLSRLSHAVEESWRAIVDGRSDYGPADVPDSRTRSSETTLDTWRRRAAEEPQASPLARLLRTLLREHATGTVPAALDARLDAELPQAAPAAVLRRCDAEVERRIAPFRSRMSARALDRTRAAARLSLLRRTLDLPRITGGGSGSDDDGDALAAPET